MFLEIFWAYGPRGLYRKENLRLCQLAPIPKYIELKTFKEFTKIVHHSYLLVTGLNT